MNWRKHRKIDLLVFVFFASLLFIGFQTRPVNAWIPKVDSIVPWTSGTHIILNITITHEPPPAIDIYHYVDKVTLDINGTLHDLPQSPQSTTTFVVQYDMGIVSGILQVRARAECVLHGPSSWSNTITVPEYSFFPLILVFAFFTILAVVLKFLVGVPNKKRW